MLRRDPPSFYVYRMDHPGPEGPRHTTGVLGALALSRPGEGGILPHEHTTPKAKSDRLNLLRATRANLSAVWGLSPAPGLSELLDLDQAPAGAWTDDGVGHTLWVVDDPDRCRPSPPRWRPPGRHRRRPPPLRDQPGLPRRAARRRRGRHPGAESVLAYVVELADDELDVQPIHRLVAPCPRL